MTSPASMAAGTIIKILPKKYYVPLSFKRFPYFCSRVKISVDQELKFLERGYN